MDGRTLKLRNRILKFKGKTIFVASHYGPLPAGVEIGFDVDSVGRPHNAFLLSLNRGEVADAIEMWLNGLAVADLDGDGRDELISGLSPLDSVDTRHLKLKAVSFSIRLDYGPYFGIVAGRSPGGSTAYRVSPTGQFEKLFEVSYGVSSLGSHTPQWADLYGDGQPIACEILTWGADDRVTHKHPTKAELVAYWWFDRPARRWVKREVSIPIPDGKGLTGLLAAAEKSSPSADSAGPRRQARAARYAGG